MLCRPALKDIGIGRFEKKHLGRAAACCSQLPGHFECDEPAKRMADQYDVTGRMLSELGGIAVGNFSNRPYGGKGGRESRPTSTTKSARALARLPATAELS